MTLKLFRLLWLRYCQSSLRSRRLEVVGTRKNARERTRHPLRVSLARVCSLFRPLLSSACYAGYCQKVTSCPDPSRVCRGLAGKKEVQCGEVM